MSDVSLNQVVKTKIGLHGQVSLTKENFQLDTGSFQIPATGVTAIFGHSGSGKTTFLRCLAGFEPHAEGEVFFLQQAWLKNGRSLPTHKRALGYVFQEASLFPHLNVKQNLKYGLKRAKHKGEVRYMQVIDWLGLEHLLARSVANLSGGERQRVSIARALLTQPKILMMDEPMASLDLFSKRAIMPYLERLRDELEIPILYISHSPEEVERLADHVMFMEQGRIVSFEPIEQSLNREGTPLYQSGEPRSVLSATIAEHLEDDGLTRVQAGEAELFVPKIDKPVGDGVRVVIAAKLVSLMAQQPQDTSMLNHLPVTLESIEELNRFSVLLKLRIKQEPWPLLAQITKRSCKHLDLQVGQSWIAAIKSASILD